LQGTNTLRSLGPQAFLFSPILSHVALCEKQIVLEHLDDNDNTTIHTYKAYLFNPSTSEPCSDIGYAAK